MKKCPTCSKTYDDNLKFCQADGTPLLEDKPEDPYKTMVAKQSDLPIPPEKPKEEVKPPEPVAATPAPKPVEPEPEKSVPVAPAPEKVAPPAPAPEPKPEPPAEEELDPMKTMMITGNTRDNVKVDIPKEEPKPEEPKKEEPKVEASKPAPPAPTPELEIKSEPKPKEAEKPVPPAPELPKFDSPEVAPPVLESTNLDAALKEEIEKDSLPTPSSKPPPADLPKVDTPSKPKKEAKDKPSLPIPSPFDKSMPPGYAPPSTPPFDPTEPVKAEKVGSMKSSGIEGSSPPAPMDKFDNKALGSNSPSDGAGDATEGQNKTLAIISLVCGVLSMTICCGVGILLGPVGAITGFMAKGKVDSDPNEYGGRQFAVIGLITGIIGTLIGILLIAWQLFAMFGDRLT